MVEIFLSPQLVVPMVRFLVFQRLIRFLVSVNPIAQKLNRLCDSGRVWESYQHESFPRLLMSVPLVFQVRTRSTCFPLQVRHFSLSRTHDSESTYRGDSVGVVRVPRLYFLVAAALCFSLSAVMSTVGRSYPSPKLSFPCLMLA